MSNAIDPGKTGTTAPYGQTLPDGTAETFNATAPDGTAIYAETARGLAIASDRWRLVQAGQANSSAPFLARRVDLPTPESLHYPNRTVLDSPTYRLGWATLSQELLAQYQRRQRLIGTEREAVFQEEYETAEGGQRTLTLLSSQGQPLMVVEEVSVGPSQPTWELVIETTPQGLLIVSGNLSFNEATIDRILRQGIDRFTAESDRLQERQAVAISARAGRVSINRLLPIEAIKKAVYRARFVGTFLLAQRLFFLYRFQRRIVEAIDDGVTNNRLLAKRFGVDLNTLLSRLAQIKNLVTTHLGEEHVRQTTATATRWWLTGSFLVEREETFQLELAKLPVEQQKIILAYREKGTVRKAAEALKMNPRTFEGQLKQAILAMRLKTAQSDHRARTYIDTRFDFRPRVHITAPGLQYRSSPDTRARKRERPSAGELLPGADALMDTVPLDVVPTARERLTPAERAAEMTERQGNRVFERR